MAGNNPLWKAAYPPGTTVQTEQQVAGMVPHSGTRATPLERDPELAYLPFPAATPLIPALINTPREDGRAVPRHYEFPVAWNLQIVEQRNVPFKLLREVADNADLVRKCIEVVKAAVIGQEWDISITNDAVSHVMHESAMGAVQASRVIHDKYQDEIAKVKDFWRMPDRMNGITFYEWIGMMIEEVMVIDALSIYPNKTLDNKNLHSLEILDGATIKPLLDSRGARPLPPNPAFQQILWGFPRGEFIASSDFDGQFTADDLFYAPRTRRPYTPYGYSPVERCLPLVDLYMKRLQWFRTEFTDGVMPDLMMKSDMDFGNNPGLLKSYEQIFNDDLAGNMEQRRRMRLLPNGFDPVFPRTADAKYSSEFDEFIVKSLCGHFGVLPSQIGFTPRTGLGGSGHQAGEADSAETLGLRPMITWIIEQLNFLSRKFLNMSHDLTFVFTDGTQSDERAMAERRQIELFSGQKTFNEIRTEMGMPLFNFSEADAPLIVQGRTVIPVAATFESSSIDADQQDDSVRPPSNELPNEGWDPRAHVVPSELPKPSEPAAAAYANSESRDEFQKKALSPDERTELNRFIRYIKNDKNRPFQFEFINKELGDILNELFYDDREAAQELAMTLRKGDVDPKALEAEVVKVRRNAIDAALALLDEMPDAEEGKIAVLWEIVDRPKVPTEQWADSKLELFQIGELYATQEFLNRDTVIWHLNNLGQVASGHNSQPNIVLHDGMQKIYDGHHRLFATQLLGGVAANCWTLEVQE